ncbi:hypothetical protein D9M71_472190 [compost metagenome]
MLATLITRQMLSWAPMSISSEIRIAKAKLAKYFSVNSEVWVRNAGPIDEVAIRKMAPRSTLRCEVGLALEQAWVDDMFCTFVDSCWCEGWCFQGCGSYPAAGAPWRPGHGPVLSVVQTCWRVRCAA